MKVLCDKLKAIAQVFGVGMSSVTRSSVAISQEVQVPQNALQEVVSRPSEPDSPPRVDGFDFWIDEIEFVDGTKVTVRRGSIVVLIGANNTGKSTVLRDVMACVSGGKGRLLRSVGAHAAGTREQILDWFASVGAKEHAHYWSGWGFEVTKIDSLGWPDASVYPKIANALVGLATTSSRLAAASEVEAHDVHREGPTNPMQALLENETVERSIDETVQEVFGTRVVLDRTSGRRVMFRCGNIPGPGSGEDRVSSGYRRTLSGFPRLDDVGDGLKSFVSVCMWLEVGPWFVRLIDEPEAFLHPPQARALGAKLSGARLNGPLFVATHSGDLLRGILDSGPGELQLLRLTRRGDSCAVHKVKPSAISEFQMDPSVMATSAVDGLFHEGVVVCEGEGDCQFYRAMLAAASVGKRVADLHFISVGGKQNAWKFARFYRSVGVPCAVVVDLRMIGILTT